MPKRNIDEVNNVLTEEVTSNTDSIESPMKETDEDEEVDPAPKKPYFFSARNLRASLQSSDRVEALQSFLNQLQNSSTAGTLLEEYIEAGGNCLELLQTLEYDTPICPPVIVLDLVKYVLVHVSTNHPELQYPTLETCRYLLNTHIVLVNKMLHQSSSSKEKCIIMQLLAAMISFSPIIVKDILAYIKLQLGAFSKHMEHNEHNVRIEFVNFICAILQDSYFPSILQLLNKSYILVSIMPGLQYDPVDTVLKFLDVLKRSVVDNDAIPKPLRVKVFDHVVVKSLVNLYDWRGIYGFDLKKQRRRNNAYVDIEERTRIGEQVHAILLVLCTSIKRGLVFRDESLGFGKKYRNALMYSVIETLNNDFDNPLREQLIIQMATEFPDLMRAVWSKLLPNLAPRASIKWFQVMNFTRSLLAQLKPNVVLRYAKVLNPLQYAQAILMLAAPKLILQALIPENFTFDDDNVKLEVSMMIHCVLRILQEIVTIIKANLPENYSRTVCKIMQNHLVKNMPTSHLLIGDWTQADESLEYTTIVIKILQIYNELSPELMATLNINQSAIIFLLQIEPMPDAMDITAVFKVAFIELLLQLDPWCFNVTGDIFPFAVNCLTASMKDIEGVPKFNTARDCLHQILNLCGYFENCNTEVLIWIDFLQHKHMPQFLSQIICNVHESNAEFTKELREFHQEQEVVAQGDGGLLEMLCSSEEVSRIEECIPKQVSFSLVLLAALKHQPKKRRVKRLLGEICTLIFYLQTDYTSYQNLIRKYSEELNDTARDSILNWEINEFVPITTDYLPLRRIMETSIAMFKLLHVDPMTEEMFATILQTAKKHAPYVIDLIYCNRKLYDEFQVDDSLVVNNSLRFLIEMTEFIRAEHEPIELKVYLKLYQRKTSDVIIKLLGCGDLKSLKSRSKTSATNFCHVIDSIGLIPEDCFQLLANIAIDGEDVLDNNSKPNLIYWILISLLNSFITHSNMQLPSLGKIVNILTHLNKSAANVDSSELAKAIHRYLNHFEGCIIHSEEDIKELFTSCVLREEYCRENALLALYIYKASLTSNLSSIHASFEEHLEAICSKKGLILPFLDIVEFNNSASAAEKTFKLLTPLLERTLAKPQKAGTHFENHYLGFCRLTRSFMPLSGILPLLKKIQKFDTTEAFLGSLLKAMFVKYFSEKKEIEEAHACNGILTLVHFAVSIFKTHQKKSEQVADDFTNLELVIQAIAEIVAALPRKFSLDTVRQNETFNQFYKLCLKHGIHSSKTYLLNVLTTFGKLLKFSQEDATIIMDMLTGHSEFMDVVLAGPSDAKLAIFKFVHCLCKGQPEVMQRKHVPLLLAAYTATLHPSDRCVISTIKLYEAQPTKTHFYDFKPFLWGINAANFYSVRTETHFFLRRLPRTNDVLDLLQMDLVENTLVHFPLSTPLRDKNININSASNLQVYDLGFLLASFSQILAPENHLFTHKFTRTGALSLVVICLASSNEELRMAACHTLARFYYHLEAKHSGKDQIIWLRFIEGLTRGTGVIKNFKLNNFAALFMARTALVLCNPTDPMYAPLNNFLVVKAVPVLTKIPELYTFLHSSDMDYAIYRYFILRILLDGMRCMEDFSVALKAMAFKLIMEMFNSSMCDIESKGLILDIIGRAVKMPQAAKELCENYSLCMWLYNLGNDNETQIMEKINYICNRILSYKINESCSIKLLFTEKKNDEKMLASCTNGI